MTALSRLKQLAEAASDGPWSADAETDDDCYVLGSDDETPICNVGFGEECPGNAALIAAANPQTILALLDLLDEAEALIQYMDGKDTRDYDAKLQALEEVLNGRS